MDLLDTHTGSTRSGMHAPALLAMTLLILACLLTGLTEVGSASPLERNALPSVLQQFSDPAPGEGLSAAVAAVPANSAGLDAALDEQKKITEKQVRAQQELQRTDEEIQDATLRREASTELLARSSEQVSKAAETQQKLHGALRVIGVEWFITGFGRLSALNPTVSSAERERLDRARVLSESAASSTISKERFAREQLKQLQEERSDLQRQLASTHHKVPGPDCCTAATRRTIDTE
ncbi:MAG: hypothetical protein NTX58_14945 [Actinobacteria bacterium]|nr:hypothetical protein [Actinomycetota bacterium]